MLGSASRSVDRFIIKDSDLAQRMAEANPRFIFSAGRGKREQRYVHLDKIWMYEDILDDHVFPEEDGDTYWIKDATSDSRWARENKHNGKGVAWVVNSTMVIQCGFIFTLNQEILELPAETVTYSHKLKGWVASEVELDNLSGFRDKLAEYDILVSPTLEGRLDGSEKWREILKNNVEEAKSNGYRLPDTFETKRTLKDHQSQAVLTMANRKRNLLADQVGLGKGGEFINGWLSIVQYIKDNELDQRAWPILITTTSSLKEDIVEEIYKWKANAKVEILYGRTPNPIDPRAEFIVTNIDILNGRKDDIIAADVKAMVVDEAHMLKNPDTLRTQAAAEIANYIKTNYPETGYITLASGTPFLNAPVELWSLLCILGVEDVFVEYAVEKMGGRQTRIHTRSGWKWLEANDVRVFETFFCDGHYDKYKKWINGGASHTAELNQLLLQTCMIRRRKSDVMHPMPKLEEHLVPIDIDPEYEDMYDQADYDFRTYMKELAKEEAEEQGIPIRDALRIVTRKLASNQHIMQLTHLRKIVAKAKIAGTKAWIRSFMDGTLEYTNDDGNTVRIGDDPSRRKLIVFAYHREVQDMLMNDPELAQYGMVYIRSGEDPEEHKRLFQEDERYRLMICYSGAREGHTLTAAKDVFITEIPFVPSWVIQMAGRCWARLSELYDPHEATVWYGVIPGTIDSNLVNRVRIKKQSFSAVIDGEGMDELEQNDIGNESSDAIMSMLMNRQKRIGIAA